MLLNYHRIDIRNAGDFWSAPVRYFRFSTPTESVGIWNEHGQGYPLEGNVIIGGGGLLGNLRFENQLCHICRKRKGKLVSWGVGHNKHDVAPPKKRCLIQYKGWKKSARIVKGHLVSLGLIRGPHLLKVEFDTQQDLMKMFDLHGLRDYGCGYNWVPCASCMHPLLDVYRTRPIEHDVVVFYHSGYMRLQIDNLPSQGSLDTSLQRILEFLSSGETIVTSTYHGAYWGILLGRKVVVVPWSTKFVGFKYPVPLCYDLLDLPGCLKKAQAFPEALEECREVTTHFAEQVADLLRVEVHRRKEALDSPLVADNPVSRGKARKKENN